MGHDHDDDDDDDDADGCYIKTHIHVHTEYILFHFIVDATIINTRSFSFSLSRSSIAKIAKIKRKEMNSKENYLKPQFYFHALLFSFPYLLLFSLLFFFGF